MKKLLNRILSPFGRGSFWVIGLGGTIIWAFIFWLGNRVSPAVEWNSETVAGAALGAFGFSYVASIIYNK